jgi:hypothetical protein
MRNRAMGILFVLSGVLFLAGVLDPPILPTWGDSTAQVMATASAHRAAWFATTWLITLSIVAGLAAVELLGRALGTDLAQVGRSLYLVGGALGLTSATYDLSVTSTLVGSSRLPDWYLGVQHWADGLGTAYFALLAPSAMGCIAVAILRTRALPRWTGYTFLIATVLLLHGPVLAARPCRIANFARPARVETPHTPTEQGAAASRRGSARRAGGVDDRGAGHGRAHTTSMR